MRISRDGGEGGSLLCSHRCTRQVAGRTAEQVPTKKGTGGNVSFNPPLPFLTRSSRKKYFGCTAAVYPRQFPFRILVKFSKRQVAESRKNASNFKNSFRVTSDEHGYRPSTCEFSPQTRVDCTIVRKIIERRKVSLVSLALKIRSRYKKKLEERRRRN